MATTRSQIIHVHVHEGDLAPIERKLTAIMAAIDDLQEKFDSLDGAVRTLLANESAAINTLQQEINALVQDDEVENSKLTGISGAMDELRGAVESFGEEAPVDPPIEPDPAPVEPLDPADPANDPSNPDDPSAPVA